jgi:prevent-host-death family protein
MENIRPISDLRNRFTEVSELCHRSGEPVFITRKGRGDLVVMSQAAYDLMEARLQLYAKLGEAEAARAAGDEGISHDEMMRRLRTRTSG